MTATEAPPRPVDKTSDTMSVDELAAAVRYHNYRYFVLDAPEISDYAFDRLTRRLEALAPGHAALAELHDGGTVGDKIFHDAAMLSLDKCYEQEELLRWAESFEGDIIETPKIDGVAASLKYDATGRLVVAATRGDGVRGESFLPNARYIDAIPKQLSGPAIDEGIEVRGELYMPLSFFRTVADQFSNPRNTTAGAMKLKDPRQTSSFVLAFYVYDVLGPVFETEMEKVAWAADHGLAPVETQLIERANMQAGYDAWLARRAGADFEMDGVVYKANTLSEQQRLGATAHHPRYAIAYKFQGDSGTSTLLEVQWSVSRTGTITPVAIIEPVELSGAMVSRCSLHNLAIMRALDISVGATVVAMRRGGVIPHIEAVTEPGEQPVEVPTECPSCGNPTDASGDFLACTVPEMCPAVVRGALEHFVKAVEIDGFGPKILAQLLERGLVRRPVDLYRLRAEDFLALERMGRVLASKLIENTQARRSLPVATLLRALGIDELGKTVAQVLAERYRSLDAIRAATVEELQEIDGIGPRIAESTVAGLADRAELLEELLEEVTVESYVPREVPVLEAGVDDPIIGRAFVFTGALATMDRKSAQRMVTDRGGAAPSSVTKDLDYLVVGDKGSPLLGEGAPSSKQKKAEKYIAAGATMSIITEAAFLELIG